MTTVPETSELGLKTNHVFLDTDIYRRYGHNLDDKVLQTLLRLTKDHVCRLHITDITMAEIRRQLGDLAAEVAMSVNKGNKKLKNWRALRSRTKPPPKTPDDVSATDLTKEAVGQFDFVMMIGWKPTVHKAMSIPVEPIFDAYFRREPPFDKTDSKEFPDAFVVAALDHWCQKNNATMYVITRDKAMVRAVEKTETLIPLDSLEDFLSLPVENPEVLAIVNGIFKSQWHAVAQGIREKIGKIGTVYIGELHDGEVVDHEVAVGEITLDYYDVISASDERIEVVAKVEAPINYDVQYLDTSSGWWDSEEKEFIGGDKEVETLEIETALSVLLVLEPREGKVAEVDILTRDVHVEEPYENYK